MQRALIVALLVTAGPALASEPAGSHAAAEQGGEHGGGDVAGYILHHVQDATYYEFELPGPLWTGKNPKLDLFQTFAFLRIPLQEGACPADIHERGSLGAGCLDLRPTKHIFMMWIAAVLLILAVFLGANRNRSQLVPRGTSQNLFEMMVLFIRDEVAIKNIGKEDGPRFVPFLLTIFFFILFMNLLGLIPFMATATGNVSVTAGLAIITFLVTQYASIKAAGLKGYLAHLTGGVHWSLWPIMVPVEILGLFTKPFALTMRLFANMLAGHIVLFFLLGLIFIIGHSAVAVAAVPISMGIYFLELFVAFLQAFIFTMLSALFIGMGVAMGHHAHHEHHDHGDADHAEGAHSHDHGKAQPLAG